MRQLFLILFLMVGLVSVVLAASSKTTLIRTVDGHNVKVLFSEVERAYLSVVKSRQKYAEKITLNDDGSVTFIDPRFRYGGKSLRFGYLGNAHPDTREDHIRSICTFLGFQESVTWDIAGAVFGEELAYLNEDGLLDHVTIPWDEAIQSITCRYLLEE